MKKFLFEILTPAGSVYSSQCEYANLPGASGRFGVMKQHMNMISQLKAGLVEVRDHHHTQTFEISAGVAEVTAERCVVLVESSKAVNQA